MHSRRPLLGIAAVLALLVGCGSGGGSNQNNSAVENSFMRTLSDADQAVRSYADSGDPAAAGGGYHARETSDLDQMDELWDQMRAACDDFRECPTGGGLSGDRQGACMPDGHMMDDDQMNRVHGAIASARAEFDDYWTSCGERFAPATCEHRRQQHADTMHGIFGQMEGDCSEWWSQERGHWGDCTDHHDGSDHDGPMHRA